ncbi:MAG: ATP-binding protein [Lachnospiraceae bacterium]|nr:ATP-binding protein [Lachnospiraceae bacterium]
MFTGRVSQLSKLNSFAEDEKLQLFVLYGRQGTGKTALLRHFLEERNHIFFTAYPTTENNELKLLASAIGLKWGDGWSLEQMLDKVTKMASEEPLWLVIDHYPNFAKAGDSFSEILHDYVKVHWAGLPIKVVLCGDAYILMDKQVLSKKSIWKDIPKVELELTGMGFYEAQEFLRAANYESQAFLYGISGGIPYHLSRIGAYLEEHAQDEDLLYQVTKLIYLQEEDNTTLLPETTIQTELRELSYYNCMLETLASGKNRVNAISEAVDKPKDVVVPYMNTLMSIGVVQKENPVTEPTNRKKTRYSIVNTHDLFWYRFVVPNMEQYFSGNHQQLWDEAIQPGQDKYMESVFIHMCREYLEKKASKDELPFSIEAIGNWWENDEEKKSSEGFDLVALGKVEGKNNITFARCYYNDEPIGIATLKELIDLTKHVKDKNNAFYLVFSRSGFNENTKTVAATIKNIMLISLEDICNFA